jgi:hypothetical protein
MPFAFVPSDKMRFSTTLTSRRLELHNFLIVEYLNFSTGIPENFNAPQQMGVSSEQILMLMPIFRNPAKCLL